MKVIVHLYETFHVPTFGGPPVIAVKLKAKWKYLMVPIMMFYVPQNNYLNKSRIFL
jgi:hypothetical protein